MNIAYFINQYPKVSRRFFLREIQALERQNVEVLHRVRTGGIYRSWTLK